MDSETESGSDTGDDAGGGHTAQQHELRQIRREHNHQKAVWIKCPIAQLLSKSIAVATGGDDHQSHIQLISSSMVYAPASIGVYVLYTAGSSIYGLVYRSAYIYGMVINKIVHEPNPTLYYI